MTETPLEEREQILEQVISGELKPATACEQLDITEKELRKSIELKESADDRNVPDFISDFEPCDE